MVRPKDQFWKYAEDLKNGRFSCKFCHRQFSGGISRIKWHLSGVKKHDIQVCEQAPLHIQLEVKKVLDSPDKIKADRSAQVGDENHSILSLSRGPNLYTENDSILVGQNNNNVRDQGDNDFSTPASSSRAPNACNEKDKYCQVVLDKKLAKLFFLFGIHPEAVVSPIFEDFVKSIVEYGPGYQLPSPDTLGSELMFDVEMEVEEYVANFIKNDSFEACYTLMVNIWVDYNDFINKYNSRLDIFAYSQRGVVCLKSSCNYGSSEGMQEAVSFAIELLEYPNRVVQLIYNDTLTSIDTIRNMVFENHPWICVNRCAAAVIDDFCFSMEYWSKLRSLIGLVRLILSYTYHHSNVSFRRGKKRPKEEYAYASIIFMLKSVLEVEDELKAVQFSMITLSSDRVKLLDEQKRAEHLRSAKFIDYIIRRKEFWSRVKAAAQVWFLLFQTQCLVNRKDSSIGYLYEMIERVRDGIDKSRNYDFSLYDFAWERFSDMRRKIIHPIHAAAAFLNPAYMCSDNFKENVEMIDGINYVFVNMVESEEKEAFTKEVQQYRMKMPKLFTAQAMTMLKTCHPRIWWDYCGIHTPVLRKYAIRILSQPCTTSICKRYQVPQIWRSEDNEDWSVQVNTMIMSMNNDFESLGLEPIILDELGGEDHDAFKDMVELVDEYCMDHVLPRFTDDTLVDRIIEDWRLSWLDEFWRFTS